MRYEFPLTQRHKILPNNNKYPMLSMEEEYMSHTFEIDTRQQQQRRQLQQNLTPSRRQHQQRHRKMQNRATIMLDITLLLMTISAVVATERISPKLTRLQGELEERGMRNLKEQGMRNLEHKPNKVKPEKAEKNKNSCKWCTDQPSVIPSSIPSSIPSAAPSKEKPTSQDVAELETTAKSLVYRGENMILDSCEGDCDADSDCKGELLCYYRKAWEPVPGCTGAGNGGKDYCYDPYTLDPDKTRDPSSMPSSAPSITHQPSTWSPSPSATWSPQPSSVPSISFAPTVSTNPSKSPSDTNAPTISRAPSSTPSVSNYPSTWSPSPSGVDDSHETTGLDTPTTSSPSTWSPSPSASATTTTTTTVSARENDVNVEFSFAFSSGISTPSPSPSVTWASQDEGGSEDVVDSLNPVAAQSTQTEPKNEKDQLLESVISSVTDILKENTGYEVDSGGESRRRILLALQGANRKLSGPVLFVDRDQSYVKQVDTSDWSEEDKASLKEQGIDWYDVNINFDVTGGDIGADSVGSDAGALDMKEITGNIEQAMATSIADGSLGNKLSEYDDRIQAVTEEGEAEQASTQIFTENNGVQEASSQSGFNQLEPSLFEPIRIIGVSMFFLTFLATACILYLAKNRKHEKKVSAEWKAYLTSDDEIERMLSHGIIAPREGSCMSSNAPSSLVLKVFDKEERGYNEENSMLMGGRQYVPEMGVVQEKGIEVKVEKY